MSPNTIRDSLKGVHNKNPRFVFKYKDRRKFKKYRLKSRVFNISRVAV